MPCHTRCRRPASTRRRTAPRFRPTSARSTTSTTPCCSAARAASATSGRGGGSEVPYAGARAATPPASRASCCAGRPRCDELLDEQHLAVLRQRPQVVGDDPLEAVGDLADG